MTRLIDLSPKEEVAGWSGITHASTGMKLTETKSDAKETKDTVQKTTEKKVPITKVVKDENVDDVSESTDDDESSQKDEKETVQTLINSYILETYKAQWDKILKDMDVSLQKKIPDVAKRIQAYDSIQTTLELRKTRILKVNISEANKDLLSSYFNYMIAALEKRKDSLSE